MSALLNLYSLTSTLLPRLYLLALLLTSHAVHAQSTQLNTPTTPINTQPEPSFDFVVRLGEGGFRDSRSPENALGGDQFALDIISHSLPLALTISAESYTNSPQPTHHYEIKDLFCINLLYYSPRSEVTRFRYFIGGGFGQLTVPNDIDTGENYSSNLLNLEAGVNYLAFSHIGFYGAVKYLYASDRKDSIQVIDYNEAIVLIGVTFNFSL